MAAIPGKTGLSPGGNLVLGSKNRSPSLGLDREDAYTEVTEELREGES